MDDKSMTRDPIAPRKIARNWNSMDVSVYFIQESKTLAIKIGSSRNPAKRMADLQVANPYKLFLLGIIPAGGEELEFALHKRFHEYRLEGEWFSKDITDEVLNLIDIDTGDGFWD